MSRSSLLDYAFKDANSVTLHGDVNGLRQVFRDIDQMGLLEDDILLHIIANISIDPFYIIRSVLGSLSECSLNTTAPEFFIDSVVLHAGPLKAEIYPAVKVSINLYSNDTSFEYFTVRNEEPQYVRSSLLSGEVLSKTLMSTSLPNRREKLCTTIRAQVENALGQTNS